tara:strand:+ start:33 stop:590 length:558 start_codon:yes stop_codon:yes gene_type:complete
MHQRGIDDFVQTLLLLAGIFNAFDRAIEKNLGDSMSLLSVIGFSVFGGALFGWISYHLYAALLSWTGKWIGGRASSKELLRVLAYGMLPAITALVFLILQIAIYGEAVFQEDLDLTKGSSFDKVIYYTSVFCEIVLSIWSFVLILIGISEVQNVGLFKAFLNLILPIFIVLLPILLISVLYSAIL